MRVRSKLPSSSTASGASPNDLVVVLTMVDTTTWSNFCKLQRKNVVRVIVSLGVLCCARNQQRQGWTAPRVALACAKLPSCTTEPFSSIFQVAVGL